MIASVHATWILLYILQRVTDMPYLAILFRCERVFAVGGMVEGVEKLSRCEQINWGLSIYRINQNLAITIPLL